MASKIFIYPKDEPKRAELIRQLALQPKMFQAVIAKYGRDLPSDANLAAYLQIDLHFTEDACPTMIKALRHAIALAGVDASPPPGDTEGDDAHSEATMNSGQSDAPDAQTPKNPPQPPWGQNQIPRPHQERHVLEARRGVLGRGHPHRQASPPESWRS